VEGRALGARRGDRDGREGNGLLGGVAGSGLRSGDRRERRGEKRRATNYGHGRGSESGERAPTLVAQIAQRIRGITEAGVRRSTDQRLRAATADPSLRSG